MNQSHLLKEFDGTKKEDWLDKVVTDLKGKPVDSLNWIHDNLEFSPFYHKDDLDKNYKSLRPAREDNSWKSAVEIRGDSYSQLNASALGILELGAQVIRFHIPEDFRKQDFESLLVGIRLEWVDVEFVLSPGVQTDSFIQSFLSYLHDSNLDTKKMSGRIGRNNTIHNLSKERLLNYKNKLPGFRFINISSTKDSVVDELGDILLSLLEVSDSYEGIHIGEFLKSIQIEINVDDNYFTSIAKLRALRLLIQHFLNSYGDDPILLPVIIAKPTLDEQSDINTRRIKETTQLSTAIIGGADIIFSQTLVKGDAQDMRIGQNIHNVLGMESFLGRVVDPVAGSYLFENMTNQICEATWQSFQDSISKIKM